MKKKKEKKTGPGFVDKYFHFLFPVGVIVAGVFVFVFLLLPKIKEMAVIRKEIKKNDGLVSEIDKKVRLIQSIDREVLDRQSSIAKTALPSKKNIYNLVVVMKNVGLAYGFEMESLKIGMGEIDSESIEIAEAETGDVSEEADEGDEVAKTVAEAVPKKGDDLERLPIKVELIGPEEGYLDFLLAMEEAIPLLSISKLDLSSQKEMASIELTVMVYFSPERGGLDLDKISLDDLMMTEEELLAAERLEGFENYVPDSDVPPGGKKPRVVRDNPFEL